MHHKQPIVAVAGFSSNVGKTTLACRLLEGLENWEAIKVTKGHFRSCGKDPHACCVSHLLSEEPLVRSGRVETDEAGKDTGRFWAAGAANVHWVVATRQRVADGVRMALDRVDPDCAGVLLEGTGFVRDVRVDFMIMVARGDQTEIKASAGAVFARSDALVLSGVTTEALPAAVARVRDLVAGRGAKGEMPPVYQDHDLPALLERIRRVGV